VRRGGPKSGRATVAASTALPATVGSLSVKVGGDVAHAQDRPAARAVATANDGRRRTKIPDNLQITP
jgi:hypothetical protein